MMEKAYGRYLHYISYGILRDALPELLGDYETDFIYDGAYNELGKDWQPVET